MVLFLSLFFIYVFFKYLYKASSFSLTCLEWKGGLQHFFLQDQFFVKQSWSRTGVFYFLNNMYELWCMYHSLLENLICKPAKLGCTRLIIHEHHPGQSWVLLPLPAIPELVESGDTYQGWLASFILLGKDSML